MFPEIVAPVLGIAAEQVTLRASDTLGPPLVASGTIGSRSTLMQGSAFFAGAREVVRKGLALAAEELEVADADVEFTEGEYPIRGMDLRVKLLDLARKYAGRQPHPFDTIEEAATARAYPSGAHVAEVEVDPDTGETEVLSYVAVDDCGRVINQVLLEGQLHEGIAQGAGQMLGENCIYDRASGQLLNGSFIDYFMPRADMMGTPRLVDRSIPSPINLLGAKGAGEAGTTASIATLMNAFADALRPARVHHVDMPLTPNRVWEANRCLHAAEIPYVFRNLGVRNWPWQALDRTLLDTMFSYWLNFAASGDPNEAGLPAWPVFDAQSPSTMCFGDSTAVGPVPDREKLEFWEAFYARERRRPNPE